jgi:para-nitrobenzyl esterase
MKTVLVMLVIVAAVAVMPGSGSDSGPVVAVIGGQVRGVLLDNNGVVFKGIPFAQPPVGDLRWRAPTPVRPWTGVRDATAFGAPCAQSPGRYVPRATEISKEDCLYLNVWAPEWSRKTPKPVMVWIHGGGNYNQSSTLAFYDGERLARRGVVLVTANYRLGAFGFFAHPELTRESPHQASGNQGILDQIAVLQWVHNNIARFGGDSANVTIFGESAGSLDVSVLMTSPLAKGLFRRVIAESGAVVGLGEADTLSQAENRGQTLATSLKLATRNSLNDLRGVSAADILKVYPPSPGRLSNLDVIVDGYVFPKAPAQVFAMGQEHRVDLILGSNAREQVPGRVPPNDLKGTIDEMYGPLAPRALALYGKDDPLYGTAVEQWGTDTTFRCGAVAQLVWHAAARNAAYQYQFDRVAPGREAVGATHGSEVGYVFGTLESPLPLLGPAPHYNALDEHISDVIQHYWTTFAKTGNPNSGRLPVWPKFDVVSRAFIQFTDAGPISGEGLRRPFCDLYFEHVKLLIAS